MVALLYMIKLWYKRDIKLVTDEKTTTVVS